MLSPTQTPPAEQETEDEATQLLQGIFEPPSGLVLRGIRRRWRLILAAAVVLTLAGLAYGFHRQTTYTAGATLQVGQVNPNSPGFYSYVSSAAALATAFSRGVTAEPVLDSVEHQLHIPFASAASRLSAEPLPLSPAFRVFATGPSEASAIALANSAAGALISYESQANDSNPEAGALLHEYQSAALALTHASAYIKQLEEGARASKSSHTSTLSMARAERDTAAARLAALGDAYNSAVTSQAPRQGLVSLLAGATTATSDHTAKIELPAFIGLLAGIVLGCALAAAREWRSSKLT